MDNMIDDKELIVLVRERPVLYDRSHPKYSNRDFVRKTWEEIAAGLEEDVDVTKKRWFYLRDYFKKRYNTIINCKAGETVKKIKWRLYNLMTFIIPYTSSSDLLHEASDHDTRLDDSDLPKIEQTFTVQPTVTTAPNVNSERGTLKRPSVSHTHTYSPCHSFSPRLSAKKARKFASFEKKIPTTFIRKSEARSTQEDDENALFFRSLLPMVRTLDPFTAMQFRQEIQGVLIRYLRDLHQYPDEKPSISSLNNISGVPCSSGANSSSTDSGRSSLSEDNQSDVNIRSLERCAQEKLNSLRSSRTPHNLSPTPCTLICLADDIKPDCPGSNST